MYDFIIVGSGFCGSVIARLLAEDKKNVLVVERRNHIAGNMYDEYDKYGFLIQKYGPHVFHTNNEEVHKFISRFSNTKDYEFCCSAEIDNMMMPSPFNFTSIDLLYSDTDAELLKQDLLNAYPGQESVTIVELLESENQRIRDYAQLLFEKDYRPYTAKQWGLEPEEISSSILKRVPVLLSYQDRFFRDKYEYMPINGFTKLFENMLSHPNITIKLNTDALDLMMFEKENKIIRFAENERGIPLLFTGAIDELFDYQYGKLPYRALWFDYKYLNQERYLPTTPIAVYPQREGYTRITEYKQLQQQNHIKGKTVIALEYPLEHDPYSEKGKEPYYPVINDENQAIYNRYKEEAENFSNLFLCGRLSEYKYYNMDNAVERAFEMYHKIKSYQSTDGVQ